MGRGTRNEGRGKALLGGEWSGHDDEGVRWAVEIECLTKTGKPFVIGLDVDSDDTDALAELSPQIAVQIAETLIDCAERVLKANRLAGFDA